MRIICVDDEPLVLGFTISLIRELPGSPEAEGFESGYSALDYLKENQADVAILDINMPDINGLSLAAKIKELSPDIGIIFLTGYSEFA